MIKLIFLSILLAQPCQAARRRPAKPARVPEQAVAAAERANAFALKFNAKAQDRPGNLFFSPYSAYSAFAMVYEGARGATAEELSRVFGFAADTGTLRGEVWLLRKETAAAAKGSELGQANAVWYQFGYNFLPDFERALSRYYGVAPETANFRTAPEKAAAGINAWAARNTAGRVKELFGPGEITAMTRLVLANAVYFKGKWMEPFDPQATAPADFTLADGSKVTAPAMTHGAPVKAEYYEDETLQAAGLRYAGGTLRLVALLPKAGGADTLARALSTGTLAAVRAGLKIPREKVEMSLPPFKFSGNWDLGQSLTALGLTQLFAPGADLSGVDGTKNLYIQKAVQKTFVEVSEEGTEAAAVTAVAAPGSAPRRAQPKVFRADKPFLFFIEDARTGLILFLGRVSDPRS